VAEHLIEEGLRTEEFPGIAFRQGPTGRRVGLVGGPDVWEIAREPTSTSASNWTRRRLSGCDTFLGLRPRDLLLDEMWTPTIARPGPSHHGLLYALNPPSTAAEASASSAIWSTRSLTPVLAGRSAAATQQSALPPRSARWCLRRIRWAPETTEQITKPQTSAALGHVIYKDVISCK
jgi:hypothetical protein